VQAKGAKSNHMYEFHHRNAEQNRNINKAQQSLNMWKRQSQIEFSFTKKLIKN